MTAEEWLQFLEKKKFQVLKFFTPPCKCILSRDREGAHFLL